MDVRKGYEDEMRRLYEISDSRELTPEEQQRLDDVTQSWSEFTSKLGEVLVQQHVRAAAAKRKGSTKTVCRTQIVHIRLSMLDKDFETFHKLLTKVAVSGYVDQAYQFVYVLEQSGADILSRGQNPHAHIRCRCMLKNEACTPGRIAAKLKRTTGLPDTAIQVVKHDNICALTQYMAGNKGPQKADACEQDKLWRLEQGLKKIYIVRENV
jgi:hypothetical protein